MGKLRRRGRGLGRRRRGVALRRGFLRRGLVAPVRARRGGQGHHEEQNDEEETPGRSHAGLRINRLYSVRKAPMKYAITALAVAAACACPSPVSAQPKTADV